MSKLKNRPKPLLGLGLCFLIAFLAKLASPYTFNIGMVSTALIFGLVLGNVFSVQKIFKSGISFSRTTLLGVAIAFMGFKLELSSLFALAGPGVIIIISTILFTLLFSFIIMRITKVSKKTAILIGVGNSICGSAAIASVSPVIKASHNETALSIGVVNIIGAFGIFLIPIIGRLLYFTDMQNAYWVGGSLPAVGHIVAAGYSFSEQVGSLSIVVKMMRILMLAPFILFSFFYKSSVENKKESLKANKSGAPWFIVFFAIFCILNSFIPSNLYFETLSKSSSFILGMAMVAIGIDIKFIDIIKQSKSVLTHATLLLVLQLIFLMMCVKFFL